MRVVARFFLVHLLFVPVYQVIALSSSISRNRREIYRTTRWIKHGGTKKRHETTNEKLPEDEHTQPPRSRHSSVRVFYALPCLCVQLTMLLCQVGESGANAVCVYPADTNSTTLRYQQCRIAPSESSTSFVFLLLLCVC
jgi:hypothetical protein